MSLRKLVAKTATMAAAENVARMALSLITLPALLNYLGQDGLGVWLVTLSFYGLFSFIATGFAASIITTVGRQKLTEKKSELLQVYCSAFYLFIISSLLFSSLFIFPLLFINWHSVLRIGQSVSAIDVSRQMMVLFASVSLNFIFLFPKPILIGRMEGYVFHVLSLFGIIISAVGLLAAITMELPIYMIGIVFLFPQQIVPFVGGFVWLQVKVGAFHKWQNTSMETTRHLVSAGTKLVIDRAAFSVAISSDLTLIGLIIGAAAGAPYGIAQRLFAIPNLILGPLSDALWPVFARADSNGDHLWLRRSFLKLIFVITVISILTVSGISIFYKSIVATWLGQVLETDWLLISGAAVLSVLHVMVHSFIMLLRSMEFSGFLARTMLAMAIVKVFFSVLLIYWIGISGAVWGSVIAYISCLLIPYSICLFRALPNTRVPANKILGAT